MPPPTPKAIDGQLSTGLPDTFTHVTTYDPSTKKSIFHSSRPATWAAHGDQMAFNLVYTTSAFPVDINEERDIAAHHAIVAENKLGLVNRGGTVIRTVDFAPGYECIVHRTQSLDYGIVVEGKVEAILDSGEKRLVARGDVVVQRGTMHSWKNASETEWARMVFVLQDAKEIVVGGEVLGEELREVAE